jgi:hypothetical protein
MSKINIKHLSCLGEREQPSQRKKARNDDWKHQRWKTRPWNHGPFDLFRIRIRIHGERQWQKRMKMIALAVQMRWLWKCRTWWVFTVHPPIHPSSFFRLCFHSSTVRLSLSSSYLLSLSISIPWNVQRTRKCLVSEEKALVSFPQALFFIRKTNDDRDLARAHTVFLLRLNRILSQRLAQSNQFSGP